MSGEEEKPDPEAYEQRLGAYGKMNCDPPPAGMRVDLLLQPPPPSLWQRIRAWFRRIWRRARP